MSLRGKSVVITTPAWNHGDGVGHDVDGMAQALLGAGCKVTVYAPQYYAPSYAGWRVEIDYVRDLLQNPETILIHHHSIGCSTTEELLRNAKCRVRIMRYHNVTPPEFFEGYSDAWVSACTTGRRATIDVARYSNEFSVPSLYDARDLVHAGVSVDRIFYTPYFHKLADFDAVSPGRDISEKLAADSRFHVLFLGRRVNNKGHLHLIRTIGAYTQKFDRDIVLHLVGAVDESLRRYNQEILDEIQNLSLTNNVTLYDKVSFADIVAFYRGCDAFLCMSEHEGFCIPVIEAEYCGLPVLAHYRRGVPEALGPTQPWLTSLNYDDYARILRRMRMEPGYARELGAAGAASVRERFDIADIRKRFLEWVESVVLAHQPNEQASRKKPSASPGRPKLAFVVQRFGQNVAGGAEAFARMYAERLSSIYDITVLTTTSKTLDWDNELMMENSDEEFTTFEILRFPPSRQKTEQSFQEATDKLFSGEIDYTQWQSRHGPDTPALAEFLYTYGNEYDAIVNWTYLFATATYAPSLRGSVNLINVPFFHDEPWLHLDGNKNNALSYDANIYQTYAEKDLAERVIDGIDKRNSIVLGAGVNEEVLDNIRNYESNSLVDGPYVLYIGRIEKGKRITELVDMFNKFKRENNSKLKLVVIGRAHDCSIEGSDDVILPGFVTDKEKAIYIKHSLCLINPSHLESFSLVLIESWALGRPVLVPAQCAATTSQVERSGGGVVYKNYRDLAWILNTLEADSELCDRLGMNGLKFYEDNYRWNILLPKIESFLNSIIHGSSWASHRP